MEVRYLDAYEWAVFSEKAHLVVFGHARPPAGDRVDFSLMVVEGDAVLGFMTVREVDESTAYLQHGGAFPSKQNGLRVMRGYGMLLGRLKELGYSRLTTFIEGTNFPMVKMAMRAGFEPCGFKITDNVKYLEWEKLLGE